MMSETEEKNDFEEIKNSKSVLTSCFECFCLFGIKKITRIKKGYDTFDYEVIPDPRYSKKNVVVQPKP